MATNNPINDAAGTFTVSATNLVVSAGNISTTTGSITSATTLTATSGAITASAGNVVLTSGLVTIPSTSSSVGQILIGGNSVASWYGTGNSFFGNSSGNFTLTTANAVYNTAVGALTLTHLAGTGTGKAAYNCAFGLSSLYSVTDGSYNSAAGGYSGNTVSTGNYNCFLGFEAGVNSYTTGSYNCVLGANSGTSSAAAASSQILIGYGQAGSASSNVCKIGNASTTACYIQGIYGETATSGSNVVINSSNQLALSSSSRTVKQNIVPMGDDSSVLYKLRPVSFKFKAYPDTQLCSYGMIAEEVAPVFPEMVTYDATGTNMMGLYYQFLTPMLVNEIQKLEQIVTALEAAVAERGL